MSTLAGAGPAAQVESVVIVGLGCAGLTAAIYAARADLKPLVLEGPASGGQLINTSDVENFPGFPAGVGGYDLIQAMRTQAERFGARVVSHTVQSVDFSSMPRKLLCTNDQVLLAKSVIVATGASSKMTGVPGEQELFGHGVSTCATCDGAFFKGKEVAVLGGGDSAAEEALFLTRFATKVFLVVRRDVLRASKIMADRVFANDKIEVLWDSEAVQVLGVAQNTVTGLQIKTSTTGHVSTLPVKGVFVAIGHVPNTQAFTPVLTVDENGYFVPLAGSQVRTRVDGVFVAGDCSDHVFRQAVTASGMGCQAAIEAERWLAAL